MTEHFQPNTAAPNNNSLAGDEVPQEPSRAEVPPAPRESKPANTSRSAAEPGDATSDEEVASAAPDHGDTLEQLDRRWVGLVRGIEAMTWMVMGAVIVIAGLIGLLTGPPPVQALVLAAWLLLGLLALFRIVWWPRLAYTHWSYRIGKKVFELRHGILWQVSVSIPLSRLQHIDLHRGPLERRRGLASLQLHTAGTKEASQLIPGLDLHVAQTLRDRLIDAANRGNLRQPRMSDSSVPETSRPETGVPETSGPETSGPETSRPDNGHAVDGDAELVE